MTEGKEHLMIYSWQTIQWQSLHEQVLVHVSIVSSVAFVVSRVGARRQRYHLVWCLRRPNRALGGLFLLVSPDLFSAAIVAIISFVGRNSMLFSDPTLTHLSSIVALFKKGVRAVQLVGRTSRYKDLWCL